MARCDDERRSGPVRPRPVGGPHPGRYSGAADGPRSEPRPAVDPIQWGAYPNATYSGTYYTAVVRADGTKIDSTSQNYAPHGSVGADRAKKYSGKILQISGNVTKGKDTVLVYNMQCRIL